MRRRRDLIAMLAGAAVVRPLVARAQRPAMPVIGFLNAGSPDGFAGELTAFRQGLGTRGYVEGATVAIDYRWAENHYDRLPAMAAELAGRQPLVLVASGSDISARAAEAATATIPIVFLSGYDPSKSGLVASVNRPGGNATGVSLLAAEIVAKQFDLLRKLVPDAASIGVLVNADAQSADDVIERAQIAARTRGVKIVAVKAHGEADIQPAFATLSRQKVGALMIGPDGTFSALRDRLVALASRSALPTMYFQRVFVAAGGLISYGTDIAFAYRQLGIYAASILRGSKPADLPILLPSKFELAINLKTAASLGLDVPPTLIAIADDVVE